jgi:hypothetical protein
MHLLHLHEAGGSPQRDGTRSVTGLALTVMPTASAAIFVACLVTLAAANGYSKAYSP